jgi:serine/threonine protein kinase
LSSGAGASALSSNSFGFKIVPSILTTQAWRNFPGLVDNLPSFVSEQLPIAVAQRPLVAPSTLVALDAAFAEFMQLTDFGVFGTLNPRTGVTRSGQMFGTPTYMSPEQIRGQKQSSATDIFGLGVLLYKCSTGQHLLQGKPTLQF